MATQDIDSMHAMEQSLSTVRFLQKGQKELMESYIASCFNKGIMSKNRKKKEKMISEILMLVDLVNR